MRPDPGTVKPAERLDDVRMDEVELTTPVGSADIGRLKLGDVVYISGVLYTAREGVYRKVVEQGVDFPASVRALTNVNFHCSPAATGRPDGTYAVEAVTATASFRFGKSMSRWFERSGAKVVVGKAGLTELAYREWFVPHGAVYLTTVGYGMGAAYGRCITRVVDVHWPLPRGGGSRGKEPLRARESGDQSAARGGLPRAAAVRDGPLRRDHLPHRRNRVVLRSDTVTRRSGASPLQRDRRGRRHGGAHQEFTRC